MRRMVLLGFLVILMGLPIGCSKKLDEQAVRKTLDRFVSDVPYIKRCGGQSIKSVGPIILKNDKQAEVVFIINGSPEITATATFNLTQDGKWIFTEANGNVCGGGWNTPDVKPLGWEVK